MKHHKLGIKVVIEAVQVNILKSQWELDVENVSGQTVGFVGEENGLISRNHS